MKDLIIIGAGGHGRVCFDIALNMNKWLNIYFVDDYLKNSEGLPGSLIGKLSDLDFDRIENNDFIVAIGNNIQRKYIYLNLIKLKYSVASLIHPKAIISNNVVIEKGNTIMCGVIINTSSIIEENCIINTGSVIEHDNIIKKNTHISPGVILCGNVTIGENSWIGAGSTVINKVNICDNVTVGAGSVVVKDITEPGTYVGVPARRIK